MNLLFSVPQFVLQHLDWFVIIILLICILIGASRGCVAQIAGIVSTVVAFIVACLLAKPLLTLLSSKTTVVAEISEKVGLWVNKNFTSLQDVNVDKIAENLAILPFPESVKLTISNYAASISGESVNLCELIAQALSNYLVLILCGIVVFLIVKLIFLILRGIFKQLRKITLVRIVDGTLGGAVGLLKAVVSIYGILYLISILPFDFMDSIKNAIALSRVLTFISEHNIFDYFLKFLQL